MNRFAAVRLHPALVAALVAAVLLLAPQVAGACAVCFGNPDSPATKGLTAAVLFLVGLIVAVLAGVALFAVSMLRRSERHQQQRADATVVTGGSDDG